MSCDDEGAIPLSSSSEVLALASKEAAILTDKEREIILGVLTKDEQLRRQQQVRVMKLKAELQLLRRKGALKVSGDWDNSILDPDRSCGRCRSELGRVINRGADCRSCRLKVCKSCREYNFRATDWVCSVCYKRMEIQAASGEWMNEFVRRPSRRRDAKVYVPAADIIKKTIRRSWTISNPTPRWAVLRSSAELRPYNSLPRGQDINNYPSLAQHQSPTRIRAKSEDVYADRIETSLVEESISKNCSEIVEDNLKRPARIHPLMSVSLRDRKRSPRRKTTDEQDEKISKSIAKVEDVKVEENSLEKPPSERHVSFDSPNKAADLAYFRSRSLSNSKSSKEVKKMSFTTRSLPEEGYGKEEPTGETNPDNTLVELCDIEPLSGTVFRKMTVRRRRQQNMRKMAAMDAGWRRPPENDLFDILLPDGEDYRLVFVNSDSSSKEDDIDDNDSSSASSFPLDECDWDYFEPGVARTQQVLSWNSPYGSPRVYRKTLIDSPLGSPLLQRRRARIRESSDEDLSVPSPSESLTNSLLQSSAAAETDDAMQCVRQQQQSSTAGQQSSTTPCCKTCGGCASSSPAAAQYIPVPVPIPVPFPVPWGNTNLVSLHGANVQDFWKYFAQVQQGFPWTFFEKPMLDEKLAADNNRNAEETGKSTDETERVEEEVRDEPVGHLDCENRGSSASDSTSIDSSEEDEDRPQVRKVYNVTGSPNDRESDDALPSSNVSTDNENDEIDRKSSADEREREEEEETSSGSADTDSNDTGTVADQKPKRFSRVFVVNHKGSSSGSVSSSSGDSDTSDNDTDTELDCGVVLTNVKQLSAEDDDEEVNEENEGGASFLSMKYIGEDVYDASSSRQSKAKAVRRKIRRKSEPGGSKGKETGCDKVLDSWINTKEENIRKFIEAEVEFSSSLLLINHSSSKAEQLDCDSNNETEISEAVMDFTNEDDLIVEKPSLSDIIGEVFDRVNLETILDETEKKYKLDYSSSPGLSDVSAESLSSSDVEKDRKEWTTTKNATHSNVKVERQREKHHENKRENQIRKTANENETDIEQNACRDHTTGVSPSVIDEQPISNQRNSSNGAKYTSLVMITSDAVGYQQVNIVTSDTTKVVPGGKSQVVVVSHTNRQHEDSMAKSRDDDDNPNHLNTENNVTVITSAETLSAFEEGLADDDSWVENLSYDDEEDEDFPTNSISENSSSGDEVTLTCSAVADQEDELRGYHRAAIDFTLHTIVEESCEESEVEQAPKKFKKPRPASATELEKYFFFGLGDGTVPSINSNREDAYSETSSIYSEGMESLGGGTEDNQNNENPEELASSRLEKYFLSGFMGFTAERRDSDGSVGSDSEGKPSPEQRRKRLVRARGTGRSHSNSLDNLLGNPDLAGSEQQLEAQNNSEDSSSSDSDTYDDVLSFDGQFDTVKRKKAKKQKASLEDIKNLETTQEEHDYDEDDDRNKTPQPPDVLMPSNLSTNKNQQSRDSGFVGSCDDLLKDQRDIKSPEIALEKSETILEEKLVDKTITESLPPATNLTRKDSFNNWSSDEETNLMMSKMRQFFKTMVANTPSSKPTTPNLSNRSSPKPFPRAKTRCKPPQLVYFENELTRLMKTVPGIRDDQVREIVEYLSSEDTWSDSYDSSDYTSSDLEGACTKSALQQQISDSCKQIINKFDINAEDEEGDAGDGGIVMDDVHGLNKETAFVYQKLVASFEKMATEDKPNASTSNPNSPPLIAKVMHHIGSRLVALMHEMSSGESHASNSPKGIKANYHRRLQQKLSNASSTTTDDDSTSDTNLQDTFVEEESYNLLPRSRSHDLLMSETNKNLHQSISGVSEISEEPSDCERFSWRGSFESALLATDSRNRLSLIGGEGSASASALAIAAKRRSAGDLLFSHKSLSREQLDRVRSCGSIGGSTSEDKLWKPTNRRRSSVPDAASCSGASADGEEEDEDLENRATLPRSVQSGPQTTNSLPRLSVAALQKAQSHQFLSQNVKSARYRPPGITRLMPNRAVSAPGLQPSHQRRGRRSQQSNVPSDDVSLSEAHSSPMLASRTSGSKSATPSPVAHPASRRKAASVSSQEWPTNDDDIDRLVTMHHNRSSLSSLGLRSDSMASVYSGAGEGRYGSVTVRGQIEFGLQYNYKAGALEIQIKQCKDLAAVDVKRNRSDPYVKVYLLPDKSKSGKRKTKVKKHTLNPVFDECLKFHMSLNELELRTLWLSVWHSDMFGRNDFLGEVMMTLENKVFDEPTPKWYNLQERTEPFEDVLSFKGDIIVCLKFVPPDMTVHKKGKRSRGSLHILVKEAKCLTAVKANGSSDPFCKSYLLPDKGRSAKQKTPVVKRTVNPVWNFTFVYDDVTLQELAERSLELTVWDHDRLASNEFLGMVRFSLGTGKHFGKPVEWMDSTGKELNLWKSMLERPNFWVEGCLPLRPTVGTRFS